MKQIKTKIKIAVIAMMGMSLGINAQITELPNGNVGIGIISPQTKLHIYSGNSNGFRDLYASSIIEGVDSRLQLLSTNAGSNGSSISLTNENSSWTLHQKTSNVGNRFDIGYRLSNNIEDIAALQNIYFSILNNGNVGIGTNDPSEKLEVDGNIRISEGAFYATSTSSKRSVFRSDLDVSIDVNSSDNYTGIRFSDPTGQDDLFWTKNVFYTDSGFSIGGNVTLNGTDKHLTVHTENNLLASFISTDEIGEIRVGDNATYTRLLSVGSDFKIMPGDGIEMAVFESDTGDTYFNGGNVGIGTTSPDERLHIKGHARFENDLSGDSGAFGVDGSGAYFGSYSNVPLRFVIQNGVQTPLYIDTTGNVGIGTTSPAGVLHLKGDGTAGNTLLKLELDGGRNWEFQQENSGVATGLKLKSMAIKPFTLTASDFNISDPTDESYGLTFVPGNSSDRGGKIAAGSSFDHSLELINTGSGNYNLEVGGNIKAFKSGQSRKVTAYYSDGAYAELAGNGIFFNRGDSYINPTGDNAQTLNIGNSSTRWANVEIDAAIFKVYNGGSERMRVNSNGRVGIGTISPDEKLTVAGNIHSREVKVTVDAGADFVFEKEYKLPTLESIEKFVKINKHLPGIASEKEMKKNGLLLAEMNIKLLQKIEELTLYTIAQEKMMKKLLTRIEKLESNRYEK